MNQMLEAKQRIGWYMNVWTHEYVVYLRVIDGFDVDTLGTWIGNTRTAVAIPGTLSL